MRSIRLQDLQAVLRVPAVAQTKHALPWIRTMTTAGHAPRGTRPRRVGRVGMRARTHAGNDRAAQRQAKGAGVSVRSEEGRRCRVQIVLLQWPQRRQTGPTAEWKIGVGSIPFGTAPNISNAFTYVRGRAHARLRDTWHCDHERLKPAKIRRRPLPRDCAASRPPHAKPPCD